jgi:hypothetical protein
MLLNIPATTAERPFGRFAVVEEAVEESGARDVFDHPARRLC